ncbi:MAG: diguanylate cyclase [Deltaproteobacteria bacterium]|nr:diguanylate cyclase [Deltaproteobacteria bacterium]
MNRIHVTNLADFPGLARVPRTLAALVALACGLLAAAESTCAAAPPIPGNPYVARYAPGDYPGDAYNFGIAVDSEGSVLLANTAGVVRFAGGQWELVTLPGGLEARALAPARDGQVYVGSFDQFGVLARDRFGDLDYTSLDEGFQPGERSGSMGEVFRVASTRDGVYFVAYSEVFLVGTDGARHRFPAGGKIVTAAQAGDIVVVQREDAPLAVVTPHGFVDVRGPDDLGTDGPMFASAVAAGDGSALLLSRDRGWYRLAHNQVTRIEAASNPALSQARCIRAATLPDGGYAVGCENGEILHLDPSLAIVGLHRVSELPIAGLAVDREGFLWAASEGEALRISLGRSWSVYDSSLGLRGTVQAAIDLDDGTTLVATTTGLYASHHDAHDRVSFTPIATDRREVSALLETRFGVLVATATGVEVWEGDGLSTVIDGTGVWDLVPSLADDTLVFAIEDERLSILRHSDDGWSVTSTSTGPPIGLSSAVQIEPGEVWGGQIRGGLIRFEVTARDASITSWSEVALPAPATVTSSTWVFRLGGRIFARDADRYFALDGERFRPTSPGDGLPAALGNGGDALECRDGSGYAYGSTQLFARTRPSAEWQEVRPLEGAVKRILGADCGAARTVLLASERGLLRFDPAAPRATVGPLVTRLRRVHVTHGRDDGEALDVAPLRPIELAPFRRLRFDLEVPSGESGVRYRTRLVGFDDEWSLPQAEPRHEVGGLTPGRYRFEAIALIRGAHDVQPMTYSFAVRPRWYQTSWAMVGAVALLGASIVGLVRWRSAALLRANAALDTLVRQRTSELVEANRRLEQQARHDDLTGLANRRRLEHFGAGAFDEATATGASLSVLMVDADHFKVINDRLGHAAGDRRLREIAHVLREHTDPARELAARYGGEEFAIILPGVTLTVARARANEIRARAAAIAQGVTSTVSIGVAERIAHEATSLEHLLHLADAGLYRAKQQGRNQVALCPPDPANETPGSSTGASRP